jgi:hypothetical protein
MKATPTLDQFNAMIAALQAFLNEGKEPVYAQGALSAD